MCELTIRKTGRSDNKEPMTYVMYQLMPTLANIPFVQDHSDV